MTQEPRSAYADYPALKEDLETADRVLAGPFEKADSEALEFQRKYRRSELTIIWGGVLAVALAVLAGLIDSRTGVGSTVPETSGLALSEMLNFLEFALTAALGSLAFVTRGLRWQRKWLRRRWAAETLRGERFLFLGRFGPYADADEPQRVLRQRLIQIERLVRGKDA